MRRLDYNREIIGKLSELIESQPDSRFGQILFNYVLTHIMSENGNIHIDDPFYEESRITLNKIDKNLSKHVEYQNYNRRILRERNGSVG